MWNISQIFKISTGIPLYKADDKLNISNHPPITLTDEISKILDKCTKSRLVKFLLNTISLINMTFVKSRKTFNRTDTLLEVSYFSYNKFNVGEKCIEDFLDLTKAFDTVRHN